MIPSISNVISFTKICYRLTEFSLFSIYFSSISSHPQRNHLEHIFLCGAKKSGQMLINERAGKSLFIQQKSLPFSSIKRYRICVIYSLLFVYLLLVKALFGKFFDVFSLLLSKHNSLQKHFQRVLLLLGHQSHNIFQYPANSDHSHCRRLLLLYFFYKLLSNMSQRDLI